ncbi:hypothetical protein [Rhodococcoides kyotonense]|uniref:Uncharacterized protein n=1 Tax=Rhodococcoides kyotonense TaxID=398843 RepID=A0A177YEW6_9NOCA|nr:hypothetical protein [Rhodococcus kyotonensis]OAK54047.1 hypothetical protein A3K89_21330 [Rhodococcus kyotonensis]
MTILNGALWGLIIASLVGVMVGGGELAYDQFRGCGCQANQRATGLLYGSILLGFVAGVANTVVTAAMT